ncbi:MAG TPA: hypothetical protein VI195_02205, partial [Steroidobacteraceae bacterium]
IPIMMYTSQEGEVYLGQARALGALGVLPKQIKPADVSKVLYQLHLVPDRRTSEQSSFTALNVQSERAFGDAPARRALTDTTLREHFAELRRALVAGVDTQTDRITAEVRALLLESLPPPSPLPAAEAPPPRPATVPWAWIVACAALLVAFTSSALWWRNVKLLERLEVEVAHLQAASASAASNALPPGHATPATSRPAAGGAATDESKPIVVPVPYGAEPLTGVRLDLIRQQLYRLARQKVTGVADIKTFAGRFCLLGSALEGYSPAPDEALFARCDLVGNPSDEALTAGQRTPLALANLIGEIRSTTHGALEVQVSAGDPANVLVPYPPATADLVAGDWNRAAIANNRVEIRVH